jgi:hypothetical protein
MAAEMAIDHFKQFLNAAVTDMSAPERGEGRLLNDKQALEALELLDLAEIYLRSYAVLHKEVARYSNGGTSSLVHYAKASHEKSIEFAKAAIAKGEIRIHRRCRRRSSIDEHGFSDTTQRASLHDL